MRPAILGARSGRHADLVVTGYAFVLEVILSETQSAPPESTSPLAASCLPARAVSRGTVTLSDGHVLSYEAVANPVLLRDKDRPVAEVFTVCYTVESSSPEKRPITFVFNGGPGAASAYLHLGAVGPKRVAFDPDGTPPPPPVRLVDNAETWLPFTDLVFVDPVGTGFSRALPDKDGKKDDKAAPPRPGALEDHEKPFYALDRDLDLLCETVQRVLTREGRWTSPVFVAGESYGGYRAARLARRLQEAYGVGLNGVVLISPALEFPLLHTSDYDLQNWLGTFPSMVAAAAFHGRSRVFPQGTSPEQVLAAAERFAVNRLAPLLVAGDTAEPGEADATFSEMADLLGLPDGFVRGRGARVSITAYARELLKDQQRVCGLYDASMTAVDPFPYRERAEGPDPSLAGIDRLFTAGINSWLRQGLGVQTDRPYVLLNRQLNAAWKLDVEQHLFEPLVGATDDLRYGMALNPRLQVFLTHGLYDLVTPYFGSTMVLNQARLDGMLRKNLYVQHFEGGHMFYTWERSRQGFRDAMEGFVARATGG